ncbi:MAG: hypothetical protein NT120_03940 [Candidatus Aenigmarchaeota archaeon]|nr:hypothetical protein [Candidatus Aenigmarchaeota archaeon]
MTGIARSPAAYFYVQKNDLKNKIRNSGIAWDLYYGGSGTPDSADARNVYSDSKSNAFNMLVANSTIYKTVIIEDPQLQQGDVNIQGLKDFVASGGLLIFAGPADLIGSGFSMHSASYANANGIVASSDDILDANKNDAVTFFNPSSYFFNQTGDSYLKAIIADQQNALIGKWNHGLGSIYYMTSVNGTVNGNSLYAALNIAGKKAEIGTALNQAKSISSTNRFSVIDERNQIVQISLLVWK